MVLILRPTLLGLSLGAAAVSFAQELPSFDGERAFELLRSQTDFGPRVPGSEAAARALAWKLEFLRERVDELRTHAFTIPHPYEPGETLALTNVRASFRPHDTRRIAFAAHWDCRPRADQEKGEAATQPVLGANDGASGVAVLLALSEILAERPPELGVDLLLFDGEDFGLENDLANYLLGSRRFVEDHPEYRPEALILLDMVGGKRMNIAMEGNSLQAAPELTHRVFTRAVELGLAAFDPRPARPVFDDHVPFLRAGIPAVDLIDMDYAAWHTLRDTPEQCSPESLRQVGTLLLHLIYRDFAN